MGRIDVRFENTWKKLLPIHVQVTCAIGSALLQVLSFPLWRPLHYAADILAWVALAPFFLVLLEQKSFLRAASIGYLCGICFYLGNCCWIYQTMYLYGGLARPVAALILLLFSMYLGIYHACFAVLLSTASQRLSRSAALALAPVFWVAVELARGRITGFPWDLLGYSQIDSYMLLRLAPVGGVMLVSFAVAAGNSVLAMLWPWRRYGWRGSWKVAAYGFGVLALVWLGRAGEPRPEPAGEQAVLLQENLRVGASARGDQPVSLRDELDRFSALTLQASQQGRPALITWPEAPSHLFSDDATFQAAMRALAQRTGAPLVVGSLGVEQNASAARGYSLYDSAVLFSSTGQSRGRYDKVHLVPWGEYVPYKQVFVFAQKLTEGVGDMDPGTRRSAFALDGHRLGIFICYESIFGDEVRTFVQDGAEVLVNLSDDGWYGDTGAPWQHLNMARMRAVENHRWVIRDTNTGETTTIDPLGRYQTTPRHVRAAYRLPFAYHADLTFYTRFGDWFAYLCAALTLVAVAGSLTRRRHALQ